MKLFRPLFSSSKDLSCTLFPRTKLQSFIMYVITCIVMTCTNSLAQVSPYSISPDWYFGTGGQLTFPSGNFQASGAPTAGFNNRTSSSFGNPEASTSVCFRNNNVALYTNTLQVFNGTNPSGFWNVLPGFIRNLNNTGDNTCAGSSTGGSVAFPDPQSPNNAFYLVIANDQTGGNCQFQGVNRYRFTGTGTTVAYNAGPNNMAAGNYAGEAITVGNDGAGGYWVVIHDRDVTNTFRVWHFSTTGITGPIDYTVGANVTSTVNTQSYLKISPCQDKIAYHSGNILVVHNFNKTTGAVGPEIRRITGASTGGVGLEFSPDGNRIFYNDPGASFTGGLVKYMDIVAGTTGNVPGSASWSLQIGPDGNIYTSPTGSSVGVISSPNGVASFTTIALPGGGTVYRGITNMAWLSPQLPVITASPTATCNIFDFSFVFQNYFNTNIAINLASVTWNWGDASSNTTGTLNPQHTFPTTGGPYTVTLSFTDQTCGQTWTTTIPVTITCSAPVQLLSFYGVPNYGASDLTWQTSIEINNNFFDLQSSVDGIHFKSIAHIKSSGNSNRLVTYHYTDFAVPSDKVYYKLVQHDYDGKTSSSNIVVVNFNINTTVSIVPNPFSEGFLVEKPASEQAIVSIYDILGRLLEQKISGETEMRMLMGTSLSTGSYIVQYISSSKTYTLHVEKK